jgi:hypothetical protein
MATHSALGSQLESMTYLNPYQSVAGAITLDSTYFYKTIVCPVSSSYTIIFPAASAAAGAWIRFVTQSGANGIVILNIGLGGSLNPSLGQSEEMTLFSDGTSWYVASYNMLRSHFLATPAVNQNLLNNTPASVGFGNILAVGCTMASTMTATYPGNYFFSASVMLAAVTANTKLTIGLWYNGALIVSTSTETLSGNDCVSSISGFSQVMVAGDTMFLQALQVSGVTQIITAAPVQTFFTGQRSGLY